MVALNAISARLKHSLFIPLVCHVIYIYLLGQCSSEE